MTNANRIRRAMRCEQCGCTGVDEVRKPANRRELAAIIAFSFCFVMPGMAYAARTFEKPYCVRCRTRVRGDGVSPFDRDRPVRHERSPPKHDAPDAETEHEPDDGWDGVCLAP